VQSFEEGDHLVADGRRHALLAELLELPDALVLPRLLCLLAQLAVLAPQPFDLGLSLATKFFGV